MEPDVAPLATYLDERDLDGYLINAPGDDSDQRYLTGFASADPFTSLFTADDVHILVRGLDRALARAESRAAAVHGSDEFDRSDLLEEYGPTEAEQRVLRRLLDHYEVSSVAVPPRFPVRTADALREYGITVVPDETGIVATLREEKTAEEVDRIRHVQRATEQAMGRAEDLLAQATIDETALHYDGEPLTSERVKEEISMQLLRDGCHSHETIVAGGADAANPHDRGSGPLPANSPIVIDIFPQDNETHYHADMTRTFCVGEPSETAVEWYELTIDAQHAAFDVIEPGVSGETVHDAVCEVYENAGVPTTRNESGTEVGFIHGTGHGVGLDIHEGPRVSSSGTELRPGHVITIEPGVYDHAVGGIRIEDLLVVTDDGFDNLTEYDKQFVM